MRKKILAIVFLSFFLLPEIFWSPLIVVALNFFNPEYYWRATDFLLFSNDIMFFIYTVEAVGLVGFTILLFNFLNLTRGLGKLAIIFIGILFILISMFSLFILWLSLALRNGIGF